MDDTKRLQLIVEAVKYCKRAKSMGMKPSGYSKTLREAIHFVWTRRLGSKAQSAQYRSQVAVGLKWGRGEIIFDHAIPFRLELDALMGLPEVTVETVLRVLKKYDVSTIITKKEDVELNAAGYKSDMPSNWDGIDPLARYKAVGIKVVKNINISN
jgi:hypothetical protein